MQPIRIVVADDHNLIRQGLVGLLNANPDFTVVGETASGDDAIQLITDLEPDVALIDLAMPGTTGFQVISEVRGAGLTTGIIVLSMHATPEYIHSAMRLGANGYVVKSAAIEELELAIRTVLKGGLWLPSAISREMVETFLHQASKTLDLTARQNTVLRMTVEGHRTKEIAFTLGISVKTVETYRSQLMAKLGLNDIPSLVRYAIRNGLAEL